MLLTPICSRRYPKPRMLSVVLSFFAAILQFLAYLYVAIVHFFLWQSELVNLLTHINMFIASTCTITLSVYSSIHSNRFDQFIEKLFHIDAQLKEINFKNTKRHMMCYFMVWVLNLMFILTEVVASPIGNTSENDIPFMFYLVYNCSGVMSSGFVIIYTTLVQIIEERFKHIADNIKRLQNNNEQLVVVSNVRNFGILHMDTTELLRMVNEFFSVSIFVVIAMFFVHLLTNFYMIGLIQKCVEGKDLSVASLVAAVLHCFRGILIIAVLCYRGENISENVGFIELKL